LKVKAWTGTDLDRGQAGPGAIPSSAIALGCEYLWTKITLI